MAPSRTARATDSAGSDGLDALYDAPPREFVATRNALAARLRQAGDEAEARRVREIPRPKASVWAINHVARHSPKLVRAVVDAFDALKKAQLGDPAATPAGVETLKQTLDAVTRAAMAALGEAGMKPSLETQRAIDGTLRGAAASTRAALLAGSLTDELSAPGFDVFGGAVPTGKRALRAVRPRGEPPPPPARDDARAERRDRDDARARQAAREAMLERRAAQLDDEASAVEREAQAAAAAAHEARQRLRELQARARASAARASRSRSLARKARARAKR